MKGNKLSLYWILQTGGWLFFVVFNAFIFYLAGRFSESLALSLFFQFILGITCSQLLRFIILKYNWLKLSVTSLFPRLLLLIVTLSFLMYFSQHSLEQLARVGNTVFSELKPVNIIVSVLNLIFVFAFWSLIYYLYHYFENYKNAEIENLKWKASANEIELNKLKSQLNPHFIFNAMNSIRALVDEAPEKSKEAITQLANILRNTLMISKNKVVSFKEEMQIVNDYWRLELVRFEERLVTELSIAEGSNEYYLPPLMVQTLVENGIKHGISKLSSGGIMKISSHILSNGKLKIVIVNSGSLIDGNKPETGFGIQNTLSRLELLFGSEANFKLIDNKDGFVQAELVIPKAMKN